MLKRELKSKQKKFVLVNFSLQM